jgi:hypothetical protein
MKEFFEALNSAGKAKRNDIIEKDFHLHSLLYLLSKNDYVKRNLAFKGGTCLIKGYMDYYRFSEDIDFTWIHKEIWEGQSKNQCSKSCSAEITNLCKELKPIADELGLKFSGDKEKDDVHISSGGRMVTFKIFYDSKILNRPDFVKVEINFVDLTIYPYQDTELKSYISGIDSEEIKFLHPDLWEEYSREVILRCYDPREIFVEKCRAALTRIAYKVRDALDIYYIEKELGFTMKDFRDDIIKKTRFITDLYSRCEERLEIAQSPPDEMLESKELDLLIVDPPDNLQEEVKRIHSELDDIREELL